MGLSRLKSPLWLQGRHQIPNVGKFLSSLVLKYEQGKHVLPVASGTGTGFGHLEALHSWQVLSTFTFQAPILPPP